MENNVNANQNQKDPGIGWLGNTILLAVAILLAIPFGIRHYNWFSWIPIADLQIRILIILAIFIIITFLALRASKYTVLFLIFAFVIILVVNEYRGKGLTFGKVSGFYLDFVNAIFEKNPAVIIDYNDGKVAVVENNVITAADYSDSTLKQFANRAATKYFTENDDELFREHGSLIRYFSVFKTINSKWKYVEDPADREYFAKASESLSTMAGDCDDHAVLMTACIKAIGGEARMVLFEHHIFPVVWVAHNKNEFYFKIKPLVEDLFGENYNGDQLGLIERKDGLYLNFDYTSHYPGGPFFEQDYIKFISI